MVVVSSKSWVLLRSDVSESKVLATLSQTSLASELNMSLSRSNLRIKATAQIVF